ncbi:MAG: glucosamine-6-phosphate deaminase [Bryobacteraceae bacterium]|nr:glucosamine-6-phosphate deaminase [Bryobacteraceae bacterium]
MPLDVRVFETTEQMALAAAHDASSLIREAVAHHGEARIVVATGNSQLAFIDALTSVPDLPWHTVTVFHMDEYSALPATHPASFRRWIRERVGDRVDPKIVHYLDGESPDLATECARYAALLNEAPLDLTFAGIGENGHIAFNDPHEADFNDPATVKLVNLDEACRRQQTGEGHFPTLEDVPRQALTMTCPALMRARHLVCCVPESRKAAAVKAALEGPVTEACPASLLRTHRSARLYLDRDSAALLSDPDLR